MIRRPPRSTLSPDTTLFPSTILARRRHRIRHSPPTALGKLRLLPNLRRGCRDRGERSPGHVLGPRGRCGAEAVASEVLRSEEHTSELQSRQYLVCRLLLEKK